MNRFAKGIALLLVGAMPLASRVCSAGGETNIVRTIYGDTTTILSWKDQCKIEAYPSGNGLVGGVTNGWVDEGAEAEIFARPDRYYFFSEWTGEVPEGQERNSNLVFSVNSPRTIRAMFSPVLTARGTPLLWLDGRYGLGTNDMVDSDGDGHLNWQEYVAGTDPTNAQSVFRLTPDGLNHIVLHNTATGRVYGVDSRNDFNSGEWLSCTNGIVGEGGNKRIGIGDRREMWFYRGRVRRSK
jgi:hypothetical protein